MQSDVMWFVSGTSYASEQEYIVASLALIHNVASTCSESSLKELMNKLVNISPDFTGRVEDFIPPLTWTSTDQATVHEIKELLVQFIVWDTKGSTAPVIHVGSHIYSTSNALYKWRTRLCAGIMDKKPEPLLAPSRDCRSKKTPLHVNAPPAGPLHPQRVWYNVRSTSSSSSCRRRPPHSGRHRALSHQVRSEEDEFGPCRRERRPERPQR